MRNFLSFGMLLAATSVVSFAGVDQGLMAFVPPGTRIITSVDVSQARNSQFGQYMLNRINVDDRSFDDLVQQTGFDPRRDLQDFVFASPGMDSGGRESKFAFIVRGSFDRRRIKTMASANGATIQKYHGVDVYVGGANSRGNGFAFLASDVAVMGDLATVQEILAHGGTAAPLDPTLQQLVTSVGLNSDAWFASVMPGGFLANHVQQETSQVVPMHALRSIVQSSGGIQFGDTVKLSFDAVTRTAKDAQSIGDVARFMASFAQMNRQNGAGGEAFASAVDQMKLDVDGDAVHLALLLPEKTLEQLADSPPNTTHHSGLQRR